MLYVNLITNKFLTIWLFFHWSSQINYCNLQVNGTTSITDLGQAPPLQYQMGKEEKEGGRNSSGRPGISSPPNLLTLSQYYMERKIIRQQDRTSQNDYFSHSHLTTYKAPNISSIISNSHTHSPSRQNATSSGLAVNRPRKLTPMTDQQHSDALAFANEKSQQRIIGGKGTLLRANNGLFNHSKQSGASRGGIGYASAAARALRLSVNYSTIASEKT